MNILLVDDEPSILTMMEKVLRKEGYTSIQTAASAEEAMQEINHLSYDVILLDVMLPDGSGFDLGPKIREKTNAYLLYLTAKTSDLDVLTGFAMGGDDYVTKPFNPLEIVARMKAVERRIHHTQASDNKPTLVHDFGYFSINEITKELTVNGKTVPCPAMVYKLLLYLAKNPNRVFTKADLFDAVWGMDHIADDNTIMVHIRRIRERIEPNPSHPQFLITVRGLGYKLVKDSSI
ncbi:MULTISPECIES: response regulator transcription factor [Pontibacillus]|uniref:Response regulator transcription factor n=1 Tax=Pontibacillus chungwhensis TaxID=265426 RepID=A0ABY8UYA5_9BACI|nr:MULTISPECIES: response regulator transcription factor [Pontibacillus]MCD5325109.1 response regulator transcription factor [Pontibacillus sp. HN14]WIF97359.1 response regulator transcription factor [Pontibacillus chungwhensis]